jgi:putative acyl-CoA dehydrogenase
VRAQLAAVLEDMSPRAVKTGALGTAGLMRQALSLALHHTAQRHAFGKPLIDQPLMKAVLADLALESEAATALALRLAAAVDHTENLGAQALPSHLASRI